MRCLYSEKKHQISSRCSDRNTMATPSKWTWNDKSFLSKESRGLIWCAGNTAEQNCCIRSCETLKRSTWSSTRLKSDFRHMLNKIYDLLDWDVGITLTSNEWIDIEVTSQNQNINLLYIFWTHSDACKWNGQYTLQLINIIQYIIYNKIKKIFLEEENNVRKMLKRVQCEAKINDLNISAGNTKMYLNPGFSQSGLPFSQRNLKRQTDKVSHPLF